MIYISRFSVSITKKKKKLRLMSVAMVVAVFKKVLFNFGDFIYSSKISNCNMPESLQTDQTAPPKMNKNTTKRG